MVKKYNYKSKVLKKRNVMRRKGKTSQARQIMALTRAVSRLGREQVNLIRTSWQRNNLPIGSSGPIHSPYICPIPYALCDPLGQSPVASAQVWADNRIIASQPTFSKKLVFGFGRAAKQTNKIFHTGGKLRFTMYTTEPSYTKVTLALIRPKKKQADQLSIDRGLKNTSGLTGAAGSGSNLHQDIDYAVHTGAGGPEDTYYGAEINTKFWDVLYRREVGMQQPKNLSASSFVRTTPIAGDGLNTTLVATGTIKIPAAGVIKSVGNATLQNNSAAGAMEQQYVDQRNEDSCYLVAILNDSQLDVENISLGFVVTDYYKAVI